MSFFLPIINAVLGVIGLVAIGVLVVIAPWQIKLLVLGAGLLFTQRSLSEVQALEKPKENSQLVIPKNAPEKTESANSSRQRNVEAVNLSKQVESSNLPDQVVGQNQEQNSDRQHDLLHLEIEPPKLSYRGNCYEHCSLNVKICEGDVGGKYRGSFWRVHTVNSLPLHPGEEVTACGTIHPSHPSQLRNHELTSHDTSETELEAAQGRSSLALMKLPQPNQKIQKTAQSVQQQV